ncbi:MAG TPA: glutamine--tRNA ligase [Bacteroidetes bacterium]|nr:glutamine--tRNA ligase [Bacteroidota bacterium]
MGKSAHTRSGILLVSRAFTCSVASNQSESALSSIETSSTSRESRHFIQQIIDNDRSSGRVAGDIVVRFPPEPNGYPHIGHAKAICLNFGLAAEYKGRCNLRFDDTNPETEDMEYVRAMQRDIRWLGFDWGDNEFYTSDYFEQLFDLANQLIRKGLAYVDSQTSEQIRETRGTVKESGKNSPFRDRSIEENLTLFNEMREGIHADGSHVLRAKIDMTSPNMLMRDPVVYRIKHAAHYRRENEWPIYPLYDFAHPLSDAIEGITHSLCTLEFDVHRPLYDWLVDALFPSPRPHQYESARLNIDYTVMSKRKLLKLVQEDLVDGWDDPRMPTLSGMRRRGYPPEAIRRFCDLIGVAKANNRVDLALLEYAVRNELNTLAPRVMCVLDPLKVILTNFPEDRVEQLEASYWPHDIPKEGTREIPMTRTIYIERSDFMEEPKSKFRRLSPGKEIRLRYGYIIQCDSVVKDDAGNVTELHCSYDPETQSGEGANRKVQGTIHWVSATEGVEVDVCLYDRLFTQPNVDQPEEGKTFMDYLNPDSGKMVKAVIEPSTVNDTPETRYQFERQGFFYLDPVAHEEGRQVWNRTVTLRDTWAKSIQPKPAQPKTDKPKRVQPAVQQDPLEGLYSASIQRARTLSGQYDLSLADAALLAQRDKVAAFFEAAVPDGPSASAIANWLIHELRPMLPTTGIDALAFGPAAFAKLVSLHASDTLSSRMAREVLEEMVASGDDPDAIVERRGLKQISDESALQSIVSEVLSVHPDRVAAYRSGKKGLIGFFMGQVMQRTGGAANPGTVRTILETELGG